MLLAIRDRGGLRSARAGHGRRDLDRTDRQRLTGLEGVELTMHSPGDWRTEGIEPDYRFSLANERTFLAWIRTSLALLAAAVVVVQLIPPFQFPGSRELLGALLASAGLGSAGASYLRWSGNERAMRQEAPLPHARGLIFLSTTLVVVGAVVLVLVFVSS